MRIGFWILTLPRKAYWFWCVVFAAHYADWRRLNPPRNGSYRNRILPLTFARK